MKKISKSKVISVYAGSLYQAAADSGNLKDVCANVDALSAVLAEDKTIVANLSNQLWDTSSKQQALDAVAKKMKLDKETLSFLKIVAENRHMSELPAMLAEFKHIYYQKHDIQEVEVLTAHPLSSAQDKKIKTILEKKLSRKVLVSYTVKPEILGGLIVKYGSSMIDDSIQGKLARLEMRMKGGQ